jgi:hypothetical protein
MKSAWSIEFATEGGPMLVADATHARHWRGGEDDGSGVVVTFWAEGLAKLPKKFSQAKLKTKQGRAREVKLATSEEAAAFEEELLALLSKLHPGAARPPQYPNYSVWYRGDFMNDEKVFGIEKTFTSAYAAMLKKLKGDVASIVIDKKTKSKALFFEMEGGGRGRIAYDPRTHTLVVAKVTVIGDKAEDVLERRVEATGSVVLGENVVAFDSALSAAKVASNNWKTTDLATGVARALATDQHGSIRAPDQAAPIGAFLRVAPGPYRYGITRDGHRALSLWR